MERGNTSFMLQSLPPQRDVPYERLAVPNVTTYSSHGMTLRHLVALLFSHSDILFTSELAMTFTSDSCCGGWLAD
jgi:hypothetical protein